MASKAKYSKERKLKYSTPGSPRCAGCNRLIKKGGGHTGPDGRLYGPECIERALDLANSKGVSG